MEKDFYQYYLSEEGIGDNLRLIEYSIGALDSNVWNYTLTNKEYLVNGEIIDHAKYCATCKAGDVPSKDHLGNPVLEHLPTKDHPDYSLLGYK